MLNELEEMCVAGYNESEGILREGEPDCRICKNKRQIAVVTISRGEAYQAFADCQCVKLVQSLRRIQKSGLADQLKKCTFDNFETKHGFQKTLLGKAKEFLQDGAENWFVTLGQTGCGKTHICTAVCGELLNRGYSVRYVRWAVELKRIKALVNDYYEYSKAIEDIFSNDVIYIDDIFKRGKTSDGKLARPTDADVKLAFEIIDTANAFGKTLIISGEDLRKSLIDIDEAITGRIFQKAGDFLVQVTADGTKNFRLAIE